MDKLSDNFIDLIDKLDERGGGLAGYIPIIIYNCGSGCFFRSYRHPAILIPRCRFYNQLSIRLDKGAVMISPAQRQLVSRNLQRKIAERKKLDRQLESINAEIRSLQAQLEQGQ